MSHSKRNFALAFAVLLLLAVILIPQVRRASCSIYGGLPFCEVARINIPALEAAAKMELAQKQAASGDFENALLSLQTAHDLYARVGDSAGRAGALAGIGRVSVQLGRNGMALEALTEAGELYPEPSYMSADEVRNIVNGLLAA